MILITGGIEIEQTWLHLYKHTVQNNSVYILQAAIETYNTHKWQKGKSKRCQAVDVNNHPYPPILYTHTLHTTLHKTPHTNPIKFHHKIQIFPKFSQIFFF